MSDLAPLSVRLTPSPPVTPTAGDGVEWRPATLDDLDAVVACEHAMNAVDHPHYRTSREDIESDFTHTWVNLERDTLIGVTDGGDVIAWAQAFVALGRETAVRSFLSGGVHPDYRNRGIGRELFAWTLARCLELLAANDDRLPGVIDVSADERQTDLIDLAQRHGFELSRYFLELRRDLADPIEPRTLEGYDIVTLDPHDSEGVRLARNDAFRDHWGSQPAAPESWASFMRKSTLRPDLSFLAVTPDGEVAGFTVAEVNEEDFEPQGFSSAYVDLVGVRRTHRGRKIAPTLLTRTLEAARDARLDKVVLDVDSESLTGATRLYESVGFVAANRSVALRLTV